MLNLIIAIVLSAGGTVPHCRHGAGGGSVPHCSPGQIYLTTRAPGAYAALNTDTGQAITCSRSTSATYTVNGTVFSAAANTCRFESNGLKVEAASTNLIINSTAINGFGGIVGAAVTPDTAVAPDGSTTADTVSFNDTTAAGARAIVYQSVANPTGPASWSIYLKSLTGPATVPMHIYDNSGCGGGPVSYCSINSTSWTRCTVSVASATGPNMYGLIGNDKTCAADPGTGAFSVYAWGAQFEGSYPPTSYIPTSGTATARQSDVISVPNSIGTFTQNYSVAADVTLSSSNMVGQQHAISTNANYIAPLIAISGSVEGISDNVGASYAVTTLADANKTTTHRWAAIKTGSALRVSVDGTYGSTGVQSTQPAEPTGIYFGSFQLGNQLNGWIKNICIDSNPQVCR